MPTDMAISIASTMKQEFNSESCGVFRIVGNGVSGPISGPSTAL